MDLSIRLAVPADAAQLHALHTEAVRRICAPHYAAEVIDGWLNNRAPAGYLTPIERGALFVVERDGTVVGFGEATPGVIVACYVDPTVVRRGVGSVIMTRALELARQGHDGPIRVQATLNAVPFYARFGFHELERSTLRRGDVDVPYVLMERP
ncbi:MAG TPA: GNAT family N-acetyltransferase [Methylomirabilota bacterium]|jgi:GNAT superfamily N-acetyltransferase